MSSVSFRLTKEALLDLDQIWIYTLQNWSKKQADRYYDVLLERLVIFQNTLLLARQLSTLELVIDLQRLSHI